MKQIILIASLLAMMYTAMAQQIGLSGRVSNQQTSEPIEAATVRLGAVTTVTDAYGNFSIRSNAAPGLQLIVSAVGFANDTIPVSQSRAAWNIVLQPAGSLLDAVTVNTGYQVLSKERATGSFEKIDQQLLNRNVSSNILDRLEGVASSLYVDKSRGSSSIFIRGLSTLNASTEPLIILDNFPYDGSLDNIDPDNIESITILRDAAASSIWGARAANGVIVITSKKGRYQQPTAIHFNSNISVQEKTAIQKDRSFMSARDFIDVEQFLFSRGYYDGELADMISFPVVSPAVELMHQQRAGLISAAQLNEGLGKLRSYDIRNDYLQYLYTEPVTQQYSLAFSGGAKQFNYRISMGHDRTQTALLGNKGSRSNLGMQAALRPLSKLEISTGLVFTYAHNDFNGMNGVSSSVNKSGIFPYARLVDEFGNHLALTKDYRAGYTDTTGAGKLLDWKYRPLDELALADNEIQKKDILANMSLKYQLHNTLSFLLSGQYENSVDESDFHYSKQTYYARNIINRFTNRAGSGLKYHVPVGGILDRGRQQLHSLGLRAQLSLDRNLHQHFHLAALAGAELRNARNLGDANRTYGYDADRLGFSMVDYNQNYPLWGSLGAAQVERNTRFSETENRFVSYFSNAALTYKGRYILSGSVRKDASNLFGVNTNQKWNPFWSAGAAWSMHKEKWYHWKKMALLKARFSYGFSGNIIPGISGQPIISYGQNTVIPFSYAVVSSSANPHLKWEETGTLNAALDFAFAKQRFSGSVDVYRKKSRDLFSTVPVDPTLGLLSNTVNAANLLSSGFNAKLSAVLIDKKVKWSVHALLDHVRSKVTKSFNEFANKGSYVDEGLAIKTIEGKDPYSLISFRWAGLDPQTGDPRGYLNDTISKNYNAILDASSFDQLKIHGSSRPRFFGSLRNEINFKQFSFSANISYAFGYYFRRSTIQYDRLYSAWAMNTDFAKRWQKPGDETFTNVPSMNFPGNRDRDQFYQYSEATVHKGDHIRLKDIQASWNLAGLGAKSTFVKNASLYAYINNLGILWRANDQGIDPDFGSYLPPAKSFALGFKTNF